VGERARASVHCRRTASTFVLAPNRFCLANGKVNDEWCPKGALKKADKTDKISNKAYKIPATSSSSKQTRSVCAVPWPSPDLLLV
jgi:hypothetical protein